MAAEPAVAAKTGIVLAGGGARGAYQVGALRAFYQIASEMGRARPYSIVTGVSAGAINASYLACFADEPAQAMERLRCFWGELHSESVFRTDLVSMTRIGAGLALDVAAGGAGGLHFARALLDTSPLLRLIKARIPFARIPANLDAGFLDGVAVAATDYHSTENVTFFMEAGEPVEPWRRLSRVGVRQTLAAEHVMASAAIPILFPSVEVAGRPFGDGCLRHAAPLSAAIHLGARKLLVVGVRKGIDADAPHSFLSGGVAPVPTLAKVLSVIINAVLLEAVEIDLERMARINRTVDLIAAPRKGATPLKSIDWIYLHPSEDLGAIAEEEEKHLPRIVRYLLRGLGSAADTADIASYLFFEPAYCERLLALGFRDAFARRGEIEAFLSRSGHADDPGRGA